MTETNNTQAPVELKEVPTAVKEKLTQEQYNEVIRAQQNAARRIASERLAILQAEISAPTQTALEQNGVKLSELAEEKGIIDRAMKGVIDIKDSAMNALGNGVENFSMNGVKGLATSAATTVGLGSWVRKAESVSEKMDTMEKFMKNPIEFITAMFKAFFAWAKSGFSDKSAFEEIFGNSEFIEKIERAIQNIDENFANISHAMVKGWKDLFKIKDFKNITLEKLRIASSNDDIAQAIGINADKDVLKKFTSVIFDKDNFAKMSIEVEKGLGTKIDEKSLTIGNFMLKLA